MRVYAPSLCGCGRLGGRPAVVAPPCGQRGCHAEFSPFCMHVQTDVSDVLLMRCTDHGNKRTQKPMSRNQPPRFHLYLSIYLPILCKWSHHPHLDTHFSPPPLHLLTPMGARNGREDGSTGRRRMFNLTNCEVDVLSKWVKVQMKGGHNEEWVVLTPSYAHMHIDTNAHAYMHTWLTWSVVSPPTTARPWFCGSGAVPRRVCKRNMH